MRVAIFPGNSPVFVPFNGLCSEFRKEGRGLWRGPRLTRRPVKGKWEFKMAELRRQASDDCFRSLFRGGREDISCARARKWRAPLKVALGAAVQSGPWTYSVKGGSKWQSKQGIAYSRLRCRQ